MQPVIASIVVGLVFVGVGLYTSARGLFHHQRARESKHWPSVSGQITAARIEHQSDSHGSGEYYPRITYEYSVDGQRYESERVIFGGPLASSHFRAGREVSRHRPGKQVTVYFDPNDPMQSVLKAGATRDAWQWIILGVVFAFAGTVAIVLSLR
jgi:hypothetical protein